MKSNKLNSYINQAYPRWLDYARYQCSSAKLNGQEGDVLNESITDILTNNSEERLLEMLDQQLNNCTGLDAFVLTVIRRNAHLPRASYRWTYCKGKIDHNVDVAKVMEPMEYEIELSDSRDEQVDLYDPDRIKEMIEESDLSRFAKDVFKWKFSEGKKLKDWKGKEPRKKVYETYKKTLEYMLHKHCKPTKQERKTQVTQMILF